LSKSQRLEGLPEPQPHAHLSFTTLYFTPSRARSGWKATAIGSNSQSATATLKADYRADLSLGEGVALALKTLTKAMDTTSPSSEKVEVAVLTRDAASGRVTQRVYSAAETDAVLAAIVAAMPAAAPAPPP
jgi:20S proteasome subunit alpha 3